MRIVLRTRLMATAALALLSFANDFASIHAGASESNPGAVVAGTHMIAGSDGSLWSASPTRNEIIKLTPSSNGFAAFRVNGTPTSLVLGLDGNIWFTQFEGNKIGQITPSGVVTEFAIPTASSAPSSLAKGADGNNWFTEFAGNKIGRISLAGVITEFPVPTANSEPNQITMGADGALWFRQKQGAGRISMDGIVTEVKIARANPSAAVASCTTPSPVADFIFSATWTDGVKPSAGNPHTATVSSSVTAVVTVDKNDVCLGTFILLAKEVNATEFVQIGSLAFNTRVDTTPTNLQVPIKFPSAGTYDQFKVKFDQAGTQTPEQGIFPGDSATVGAYSGGGGGGGCTTSRNTSSDPMMVLMLLAASLVLRRKMAVRSRP